MPNSYFTEELWKRGGDMCKGQKIRDKKLGIGAMEDMLGRRILLLGFGFSHVTGCGLF